MDHHGVPRFTLGLGLFLPGFPFDFVSADSCLNCSALSDLEGSIALDCLEGFRDLSDEIDGLRLVNGGIVGKSSGSGRSPGS